MSDFDKKEDLVAAEAAFVEKTLVAMKQQKEAQQDLEESLEREYKQRQAEINGRSKDEREAAQKKQDEEQ